MNTFVAKLLTFEKKKDEINVEEEVFLEFCAGYKSGEIELAFDDRNERVYLRFSLADLMTHAMRSLGEIE